VAALELELYVAGPSARSALAIANLRRICDQLAGGEYRLEVIDILQSPARAKRSNVVATPTLIRRSPGPERRLIGDLSATQRVVASLDPGMGGAVPPLSSREGP
jgi:circadian clock protein KaiB